MPRIAKAPRGRPPKPDHVARHIYCHGKLIEAIDQTARVESRTFSAQVEVLIREALTARGVELQRP